MKIRLSAREKDIMESKYDPEGFDAENKNTFQNKTNASNLALEMYYLGYNDLASISKAFKERNYNVDEETKEVIKAVIKKMENKPVLASLRKKAGETCSECDAPLKASEQNSGVCSSPACKKKSEEARKDYNRHKKEASFRATIIAKVKKANLEGDEKYWHCAKLLELVEAKRLPEAKILIEDFIPEYTEMPLEEAIAKAKDYMGRCEALEDEAADRWAESGQVE